MDVNQNTDLKQSSLNPVPANQKNFINLVLRKFLKASKNTGFFPRDFTTNLSCVWNFFLYNKKATKTNNTTVSIGNELNDIQSWSKNFCSMFLFSFRKYLRIFKKWEHLRKEKTLTYAGRVRKKLHMWHVSSYSYAVSENITLSNKAFLILLMPAFFCNKSAFFGQNSAFTQSNIVRVVLKIF